ncbi:hypothetical protein D9619_010941 [Psilocybe cf. subviscida]|uniref:EF-hand domain-containing protein n=1 Tax=Psilocybe cf. subviscida TaxID=2480587 RepID=A0A8H5B9S8_9AGAR|nr:hypothetical protein D9619_010941 [Psilocybe cf. subviscida]
MDDGAHAQHRLTLETTQEETWAELRQFYAKNHASIERSKSLNIAQGQFQEQLDQVLEASQVLLDGLVALANVHPVVGLAVLAFHGMIKLDITRKENNRKVLAVKLQMQSMMSAMFQMCELKHIHILDEPQKAAQREQLQELVKTIADEIKQCGSDLNYYSDRKFVSKLFKAKIYERRFAEHVETFTQRRSELQTTITAYISAGIDAANTVIGQVGQTVEVMDTKIDLLLAVFQRLDTPSERELLKIIEENGAENCINKDDLLKVLLTKSGQSVNSLVDARKALRAELIEDFDKVLSQNLGHFEKLLVVQNDNLEHLSSQIEEQGLGIYDQNLKIDKLLNHSILILEEGKLIKKALGPNTRIKLKDPELQQIWDRMGLSGRRSVKAKQFVLTLRDYLIASDRSVLATPEPLSALSFDFHESAAPLSFPVPQEPAQLTIPDESESDAWVLKHINATHVQPIIEAIDLDGSGFISVQEANKFARSRPKGMKFLPWIAYWAAGWHYNIIDYRSKIYRVMQTLHLIAANVLPVNRKLTDLYMDSWDYYRIEGILRPIRLLPQDVSRDPPLAGLATAIATAHESRLKNNLEKLSYVLRSPADVALVIGTERLETSLLPLLYLLLDRHLAIFEIAKSRVLSSLEFRDHRSSVQSILSMYDERMRRLRDVFRQVNHDTEVYCSNFAYGMFLDSFKQTPDKAIAGGNTLLEFDDDTMYDDALSGTADASKDTDLGENSENNLEDILSDVSSDVLSFNPGPDVSILTRGVQDPLSVMKFMITDDLDSFDDAEPNDDTGFKPPLQDYVPYGIEGRWVGMFAKGELEWPPFECVVQPIIDGRLVAKGRDYADPCRISGLYDDQTGGVSFQVRYPGYTPIQFNGSYDSSRDTIGGSWSIILESSGDIAKAEDPPQTPEQTFSMTRHSTAAFRFRKILDEPEDGAPLAGANTARRRWAFAIEAVLFNVEARMGSWDFMRCRIAERNEWNALHTRDVVLGQIFPITRGFITVEQQTRWYEKTGGGGTVVRWSVIHAGRPLFSGDILRSERIKRAFRESNSATARTHAVNRKTDKSSHPTDTKTPADPPVCTSCSSLLTLPCWACAVCTPEILLCLQCEKSFETPLKHRDAMPRGHSSRHHLMRISDSVEEGVVKLRSHSEELNEMEIKISKGIRALEEYSEDRINALEEKLEEKLDSRLGALESKVDSLMSLMQQVLLAGEQRQNNLGAVLTYTQD